MPKPTRWKGARRHYDVQEWEIEKLEPAWAKASLYFRSGLLHHFGHGDDEVRCQSMLDLASIARGHQKRFEAGHDDELLHVIAFCALENLPLPTWAATAFRERFGAYNKATPGGPPTLDAALLRGSAPATAAKLDMSRRDWRDGARLWRHVTEHADEHAGLAPALRHALADLNDVGVSMTKARELVEWVEAVYIAKLPGHVPLLSRFRPKRRKLGD